MGNACLARDDDFEEDRRAYDAYKRLHSEVKATLSDHARLQQECAQSFRMACADRCVPELNKPLLMEMTFHFIRRLQCDSNERVVRTIMQDLDKLCPGSTEPVNQVKFTEFTRTVLRHIEHELKDKLNRLNDKSGGMFGAIDDRGGGVVPPTLALSDPNAGRPDMRGQDPRLGPGPGPGRYPGAPGPSGLGPPHQPGPPGQPGPHGMPPGRGPYADMPLQPPAPAGFPQDRPFQPTYAPNAAPQPQPPPEPEKRKVFDLLPSTGNLRPDPEAQPHPSPQVLQPQQLQQLPPQPERREVDVTFDGQGIANGHGPPEMASVDGKLQASPAAEYDDSQLEAMKKQILSGNLRVQVYNQHFQPETKRLALHGRMGLIAIFGNDGKAVASFNIADLQCLTRGIAKTIMDPPPDPAVTSALRFKDRFLCIQFDNEVTCHYALKAFGALCGVPIYDASDPSAEPPRSTVGMP